MHSTKRPLCRKTKTKSVTKRRKKELEEDMILQKALSCMEKGTKREEEDDMMMLIFSSRRMWWWMMIIKKIR